MIIRIFKTDSAPFFFNLNHFNIRSFNSMITFDGKPHNVASTTYIDGSYRYPFNTTHSIITPIYNLPCTPLHLSSRLHYLLYSLRARHKITWYTRFPQILCIMSIIYNTMSKVLHKANVMTTSGTCECISIYDKSTEMAALVLLLMFALWTPACIRVQKTVDSLKPVR